MSTRRMILAFGLGTCMALGGCGGSSDAGPRPLTEAQKAEQAARNKETAEAFKAAQQAQKRSAGRQKPGHVVNGVRTS